MSMATNKSLTKNKSIELIDESLTVNVPKHYRFKLIGENVEEFNEFSNFTLTISKKYLDNKIRLTPKSFEDAVHLLNVWLNESDINKIVSNSKDDIAFVSLFEDSLDLGFFLEELWKLKSDNKLSVILQKYGVYSTLPERTFEGGNPTWLLEALFRGIHELRLKGKIDSSKILTRVGSYSILNTNDALLSPTKAPSQCEKSKVYSDDVVFKSRALMLSERIVHWVNCEDGEKYVYLWEQGWFKPSREILDQIKN